MPVLADQMTEDEAIDLAVKAMQVRLEQLKPSLRAYEIFGETAPHESKREAARYKRLKEAQVLLKRMKWYNV